MPLDNQGMRRTAPVKVRVKPTAKPATAAQQRESYAALPVAGRQAQLQSKGVLAPAYKAAIGSEHAARQRTAQDVNAATAYLTRRAGPAGPAGPAVPITPARAQRINKGVRVLRKQQQAAQDKAAVVKILAPSEAIGKARLTKVQDGGPGIAAIHLASKVAPLGAAAAAPLVTGTLAAVDKLTGAKTVKAAKEFVGNAGADAAELAITTPSSLAKTAVLIAGPPKQSEKAMKETFVDPYVNLAKHPEWALSHPVSTALMLQPIVRAPGLGVGRVLRATGKQTLERPSATLPGSALKQQRVGSRDAIVRAVQARRDVNAGPRVMSDKEILRRTDEFFDVSRKHTARVMQGAAAEAHQRYGHLPETERQAATDKYMQGRSKGARKQVNKMFATEFGGTAHRTPEGILMKPKGTANAAFHATREEAQALADTAPFDATVIKAAKDQFAVVPKIAAERLRQQRAVGTGKAVGSKLFRVARRSFTQAVLPLSAKWLTGQGGEASFRAATAGAGPRSYLLAKRTAKEMNQQVPGSGDRLLGRTLSGQAGLTGPAAEALGTAQDFALGRRSLADEFAGTGLAKPAKALTKAGATPGIRHVRAGWQHYTHFVFEKVNGRVERTAQTAMLGKAIANSPLMERHLFKLSDQATKDAAAGLHGTEAQVQLGREVDKMYGKYSKFSNDQRESLMHSAPFYPWFANVVHFLGKTLPVDHPIKTALLADLDAATEDWRKAHGLSLRGSTHKPDFLMGTYPVGQDQSRPIGHFLPFLPADVPGTIGQLFLPQFAGIRDALLGRDFKGVDLKGSHLLRGLVTGVETHVPGTAQLDRILGLSQHYLDKKGPSVLQGKPVLPAVAKVVNPVAPTAPGHTATKGKASSSGVNWGGSGGTTVRRKSGGGGVNW